MLSMWDKQNCYPARLITQNLFHIKSNWWCAHLLYRLTLIILNGLPVKAINFQTSKFCIFVLFKIKFITSVIWHTSRDNSCLFKNRFKMFDEQEFIIFILLMSFTQCRTILNV
ncbi:Hypothetical_protein [Hexamita inflata]|uniref:Hypothetical_protein n=1 Tax=Hexamita inflata TaxID=28002 RepID=A0AA86QPR3_9EUKA|nr:Hypothetical protein HINF_LOCUS45802 [Hexamita inflata]